MSRGWAYQERLLSPRVAYFHKAEVFWECRAAFKCQCGARLSRRNDQPNNMTLLKPILAQVKFPRRNPLGIWGDIISTYSSLHFTYPEDKLPALAGIAALFSLHVKGFDYLAGTWRALLPGSLFWRTRSVDARLAHTRSTKYQAPSWSWASANARIWLEPGKLQKDCTILDIQCRVPGKNPFGVVAEVCLKIRCLYLEYPIFEDRSRALSDSSYIYRRLNLSFPQLNICFTFHADNAHDYPGTFVSGSIMPYTVAFLATSRDPYENVNHGCPLVLVLRKSLDVEGSYVRVGFGTCEDATYSAKEKWRRDKPMKVLNIV
jgi:hypothetical protein